MQRTITYWRLRTDGCFIIRFRPVLQDITLTRAAVRLRAILHRRPFTEAQVVGRVRTDYVDAPVRYIYADVFNWQRFAADRRV